MNPALPKLVHVCSVTRNGGIGRAGDLLWRDAADMAHFKAKTWGHPVLMGRATWESLPARVRPLPGRRNVVLTRQTSYLAPGAEVVHSLDQALALLAGAEQVGVIGGAELFALTMDLAAVLELTEIDAELPADTFYPPWPRAAFEEVSRVPGLGADGTRDAFVTYRRQASKV
jgi:dihydrofolate reductase